MQNTISWCSEWMAAKHGQNSGFQAHLALTSSPTDLGIPLCLMLEKLGKMCLQLLFLTVLSCYEQCHGLHFALPCPKSACFQARSCPCVLHLKTLCMSMQPANMLLAPSKSVEMIVHSFFRTLHYLLFLHKDNFIFFEQF